MHESLHCMLKRKCYGIVTICNKYYNFIKVFFESGFADYWSGNRWLLISSHIER